jgi:hypothetical protein
MTLSDLIPYKNPLGLSRKLTFQMASTVSQGAR